MYYVTSPRLNTVRLWFTFLFVACIFVALPSLSGAQERNGLHVLASTAWTGAIAEAAGAEHVRLLASLDLRHPPERDFRPSDIEAAVNADIIIWAGYEEFVEHIVAATDIDEEKVRRISTANTPEHLIQLTRQLASEWGTTRNQQVWEEQFRTVTADIEKAAKQAGVENVRVVAVHHMVPFLQWLGYDIVETFGFEEMTPARLYELANVQPDLVVDVWHNPTAQSLAAATTADYVELINFPGRDNTLTLIDVFTFNAALLGLIDQ